MIIEYSKVMLLALWKKLTLVLLLNLFVFKSIADRTDTQILSNNDFLFFALLALFSAQNLSFAFWLQWSKHHQNFWRQLVPSDTRRQAMHFSLFVLVSAALQLLPLLLFLALQNPQESALSTLDYVGAGFVWLFAFLAYGVGMISTWWRKWPLLTLVFFLPSIEEIFLRGAELQLTVLLIVSTLMAVFVFVSERYKRLLIAVMLSFCAHEMILFSSEIVRKSNKTYHETKQAIESAVVKNDSGVIFEEELSLNRVRPFRQFAVRGNNRADWLTLEYDIPSEFTSTMDLKNQLELGITQIWQQHDKQAPLLRLLQHDRLALIFSDAFYVSNSMGEWQQIWSSSDDVKLQWFQNVQQMNIPPSEHSSNNSGSLLILLTDLELFTYHLKDKVTPIDSISFTQQSVYKKLYKLSTPDGIKTRLLLLNKNKEFLQLETAPGEQKFVLQAKRSLDLDPQNLTWNNVYLDALIGSFFHTKLRFNHWKIELPAGSSILPLLIAFQLMAMVVCGFWYRKESRSILWQNMALVTLMSWPFLIALLFCAPRNSAIASGSFVSLNPGRG